MWFLELYDFEKFEDQLHIPLDSYILGRLKKELPDIPDISPWSKCNDYEAYLGLQNKLRESDVLGKSPLKWECKAWIEEAKGRYTSVRRKFK